MNNSEKHFHQGMINYLLILLFNTFNIRNQFSIKLANIKEPSYSVTLNDCNVTVTE